MVHDVPSAESNSYLPIFLCRMMHAHKFLSNRVLYALFVFLSPLHRWILLSPDFAFPLSFEQEGGANGLKSWIKTVRASQKNDS